MERIEYWETIKSSILRQLKIEEPESYPNTPKSSKQKVKEQICPVNFEEIKNADDLDRVSKEVIWQNFEKLAAFIFEENSFSTKTNIVKTLNKKRRQYDIIAKKNDKTFLVECKKWSGNRYRLSALKTATKQHRERTEFLLQFNQRKCNPNRSHIDRRRNRIS